MPKDLVSRTMKPRNPVMPSPSIRSKVEQSLQNLENYLDANGWSGYDPYDALNSPILTKLAMNSTYLKIAFTQAFKLSPLNLRPFFGVRRGVNPKGMGLFLSGYLKRYRLIKSEKYLQKIHSILSILERTRSKGFRGYCWGYHFDWQSRSGFTRKYTPTIVNTVFIAHAYLDAYEQLGDEHFLSVAKGCRDFILNDLNVHEDKGFICFSYTPYDHTRVYNATILGSGFLARLFTHTKESQLLDYAKRSAGYVIRRQKPDGSWSYADSRYQKWIDSHHTGFVLEGLYNYISFANDREYVYHLKRGLDYYKKHFFLSDGYPMFYNDRRYPVDVHCPAQAIVTFCRLSALENNQTVLDAVTRWLIDRMQDSRGYFYYRMEKYFKNKIPYIRWSQAWVFHALTTYLQHVKSK